MQAFGVSRVTLADRIERFKLVNYMAIFSLAYKINEQKYRKNIKNSV